MNSITASLFFWCGHDDRVLFALEPRVSGDDDKKDGT